MIPIGISSGNSCPSTHPPHTLLAADIGGTKSNLALYNYDGSKLALTKEEKYPTKDLHGPGELIKKFLGNAPTPDRICLGVAGPVQDGKAKITNVPWEIDAAQLSAQFDKHPVFIVNDLEANAYGLATLEQIDIHALHTGQPQKGNIALISPGTGLGEAGLFLDGTHYYPFATEGGHSDFSPITDLDDDLLVYLRRKFGHVSWERVLSGPGIVNIFSFLKEERDMDVPGWLLDRMAVHDVAAEISENGDSVAICVETMRIFFRYLATEAGNLALKLKATGGIYIGGGIVPKNVKKIDYGAFMKAFREKGRMKPLLEDIPVQIILNEKTALTGAAWYAINKC
ncbi:glucokinase [Chitinophaga sp. LS1]|uniref:glucokinase n=1 Tax=Chitinophaga sp. LS1 TaxID=3051176 RepID=UPI002AABAD1C|nr:glucokinase [Chitinophaga sp. LS1]WPV70432.1 glucokinase [Chitinophaga sp. LS1]